MFNREKRKAKREAERFVDDLISSQGRDPKLFITDKERAYLMAMAMKLALWWGVVTALIVAALVVMYRIIDGHWLENNLDTWVLVLLPLIVLGGVFLHYRKRFLDRAASGWAPKRARMIEDTLRMKKPPKP
ncbi:MAG: hypothetical protein ACKVP3_27450 [Hyphomicrobiaceae bacterium]